ncbi:MAG: hypothetical protein WC758_07510 [Candidatus Woesearchaeota archaeon]|jgi:hypothetical protein
MSEYILESLSKITWNDFASAWIWFLIIFLLVSTINLCITVIDDIIKEKKKEDNLRICMPYKKEYKILKNECKYKEASAFAKDNDKYSQEVYYY